MPVPGEMVDYRYDGSLFHSVVVYSDLGGGKYSVWDWHHDVNNLKVVNLNLDSNTIGGIGRIYDPIPK
jgi:hypothetical protein